jgi:F-type H+/Na+-transporting ATPase subunit alpha
VSEIQGAQPNVPELLRQLREQARTDVDPVRILEAGDISVVRRISSEVAALSGVRDLRPNVNLLTRMLATHVEEITADVELREVGTVQHVGNGVATLSGLPQSRINELVTFPTNVQGMILNLERDTIDVILLGASEGIQGGDLVTATGERLSIPVGSGLIGRVVNPLAESLDKKGSLETPEQWYLERNAPGIVQRAPVEEPLLTGWKVLDALVPIGRGQRELIVGDRQTGKTTLAVDAILNQRDRGVLCFYVAIGQKKSTTLGVIQTLERYEAMDYTTVVVSGPDEPPALRYLAPYAGMTMAESIMRDGRDVLIVFDDLTKHANAYRELSLLLNRPPGREAYPGDIFYAHSRLLERACKLNEDNGGGSITALPIVETQQGNISAYIPTNLISITDGQIRLEADLFNQGIKPSVDAGRSVSRVGGKAQVPAIKALASNLRLELTQYEEVERFSRFGTEIDEATRQQIRRGERWRELLTQPIHKPRSLGAQILILWAASEGYLDDVSIDDILTFERKFVDYCRETHPTLVSQLDRAEEDLENYTAALEEIVAEFRDRWFREESGAVS